MLRSVTSTYEWQTAVLYVDLEHTYIRTLVSSESTQQSRKRETESADQIGTQIIPICNNYEITQTRRSVYHLFDYFIPILGFEHSSADVENAQSLHCQIVLVIRDVEASGRAIGQPPRSRPS